MVNFQNIISKHFFFCWFSGLEFVVRLEFTVHMQNQLQAGFFVGFSNDVPFFSNARAMK